MNVRRRLQLLSECLEPRTMLSSVTYVGDRVIAIGTPGDDSIAFSVNGNDVQVRINGQSFGPFTAPRRLEARGLAGNDSIQVLDTGAVIPVEFHGGDGRDTLGGAAADDLLFGDGGADIILGRNGSDTLMGNGGSDFLIGGPSEDTLDGGAEQDIIIGGFTSHGAVDLQAVLDVWQQPIPYRDRIADLEDVASNPFLFSEQTVLDDDAVDRLTGGAGIDWFFLTGNDIATIDDLKDHEINEAINSLLPHPDNFLLLHQHLALAALVPDTDVTHTAIHSGPWSDPATWINGIVPGNAARVLIPAAVVVTVDGVHTTPLKTVRVDGTLRFDPSIDTALWVDTIVGNASGTFEMGTETQPIAADKTARLVIASDGPIDRAWDPFAFSRGMVFQGVVSIFGAEKTSWLPLAMPPMAGDTTLQLSSSPVGWAPGDKIVVAGTNSQAHEDEVRQIISVNASTITIDALVFDHSVPRSDLQVHVANLDRNAVIESQSRSLVERGHVMFHHDAVVQIAYAAFQDLGRTNKSQFVNNSAVDRNGVLAAGTGTNQVGRYPLHFHRQGIEDDGAPAMVRGTVVSGSPGWGFVNHSSNVIFEDNVAYDVVGAGFVNEAGNEIGAYRNNIAIRMRGDGMGTNTGRDFQDFGHGGIGFWFQGTAGVEVTGNVAAGNSAYGFAFYNDGLIEGDLHNRLQTHRPLDVEEETLFPAKNLVDPTTAHGAVAVRVRSAPITKVHHNTAYASRIGAEFRSALPLDRTPGQESVYSDFVLWNNRAGATTTYINHTTLRNIDIVGNPDNPSGVGMRGSENGITANVTYENISIVGYEIGLRVVSKGIHPDEVDSKRINRLVIDGGRFRNIVNIQVPTAEASARSLLITGDPIFTGFSEEILRGRAHFDIQMHADLARPVVATGEVGLEHLFWNDVTILDFGRFDHKQLFYKEQSPDFVPFPAPGQWIDPDHVGKTNQELFDQFGVAIAGAIVQPDAATDVLIDGFVDDATQASIRGPSRGLPSEKSFTFDAVNRSARPGASFKFDIDWDGDLVIDETVVGPAGMVVHHAYDKFGAYTLTTIATDENGRKSPLVTHQINISQIELINGTLRVAGSSGNDRLYFGPGLARDSVEVIINGVSRGEFTGVSSLYATGRNGNDVIEIDSAVRLRADLYGDDGDDLIIGSDMNDVLSGGFGNDTLVGQAGDDLLRGGVGDDTYSFDADTSLGSDTLTDTSGVETIRFAGTAANVAFNLGITTAQSINGGLLKITLASSTAFDHVIGGDGNDSLTGNGAANSLTGGRGNDTLNGGGGNDTLNGADGDDLLIGLAGNDVLNGGQQNDRYQFDVDVALGSDTIIDADGIDVLDFALTTTVGITLDLALSSAQALHTNHTLKLQAGTVIETVLGTSKNDIIQGNDAANILVGNAGNDRLEGRPGRDILIGGLGLDILDGGADDDLLIGGTTTYDGLISKLNIIRTEWTSGNLYASRVANLRAGVGSPVVSLKAKVNVLNDSRSGSADSLTGGSGNDWFFSAIDDVITDLFAGELRDLL